MPWICSSICRCVELYSVTIWPLVETVPSGDPLHLHGAWQLFNQKYKNHLPYVVLHWSAVNLFLHLPPWWKEQRRLLFTVGPSSKNPPKIKFRKFVKLTHYLVILMPATLWQILNMKCMQWPETLIKWIWWNLLEKTREITSSELIFGGFPRLKPLCTGAWKWPMIEQLLRPEHDLTFDLQFIFLFFLSERVNQGWRQ